MAPPHCPSPMTVLVPPGEPRYEDLPVKIDLRIHVKHEHWAVQKPDRDAIRGQLDKLSPNRGQFSDRARRLIVEQIPRLRRYSRFLIGDFQAADDLVQETLVRAIAAIDSWRPDSNMRAWLFMIMKNVMRNDFRRARIGPVDIGQDVDSYPRAAVKGSQESRMALLDVQRALDQIPGEFKQVVILAGVEGFRYEEIAMITSVPVGTVRSRLSRGRALLRALMSDPRQVTNDDAAPNSPNVE